MDWLLWWILMGLANGLYVRLVSVKGSLALLSWIFAILLGPIPFLLGVVLILLIILVKIKF